MDTYIIDGQAYKNFCSVSTLIGIIFWFPKALKPLKIGA